MVEMGVMLSETTNETVKTICTHLQWVSHWVLTFNIAAIFSIGSDRLTLHLACGSIKSLDLFLFMYNCANRSFNFSFADCLILYGLLNRSILHKYLLYQANKSWKVSGFLVWCLGKLYPAFILGIVHLVRVASLVIVFCLVFVLRSIISIAWQAGKGKARFMLYLLFSLDIFLNFIFLASFYGMRHSSPPSEICLNFIFFTSFYGVLFFFRGGALAKKIWATFDRYHSPLLATAVSILWNVLWFTQM